MILENHQNLTFTVHNYTRHYETSYICIDLDFDHYQQYSYQDLEELNFNINKHYIYCRNLFNCSVTCNSRIHYKLQYNYVLYLSEEEYKLQLRLQKLSAFK